MSLIEVQVLRELQAFTRPQTIDTGILNPLTNYIQLNPGYAGSLTDNVRIKCNQPQPYVRNWHQWLVCLYIDNIPMGDFRPIPILMEYTDIPSAMAHWDNRRTPIEHLTLGGWYTLIVRCIDMPPIAEDRWNITEETI